MSTLPYMAHIKPSDVPYASSGTWTLSAQSVQLGGMRLASSAQNDYIEWPVLLAAGTYRFTLIYSTAASAGIYTVTLDGATIATIDSYAGSGSNNVVTQASGIAVTAGNHLLRITMADKNASSSGYAAYWNHITLMRTGN